MVARKSKKKVRYAMVGLGHITQIAALPGVMNSKNSEVTALVSNDPDKQRELAQKYGIDRVYSYEQYDDCLQSGEVDAVFIGLPNNMHREYTVRAAQAGVHILCEKPMAVTEEECQEMIDAAEQHRVKLMIAYRLHFEEANLKAVELIKDGQIGEPRVFNSLFAMQLEPGNIRAESELGGGTLYDIGIYCINAARYLFRQEPIEVFAFSANSGDKRFREIDEMTTAVLRFPDERLATFTSSFGAADVSQYQVLGTKGHLRLDPAYSYREKLTHFLTVDGKTSNHSFRKRDHFGAEFQYFSQCILQDIVPEPSGKEGLADVRIIEALYYSAASGQPVKLDKFSRRRRPDMSQEIYRPPVKKPVLVEVHSPHR